MRNISNAEGQEGLPCFTVIPVGMCTIPYPSEWEYRAIVDELQVQEQSEGGELSPPSVNPLTAFVFSLT